MWTSCIRQRTMISAQYCISLMQIKEICIWVVQNWSATTFKPPASYCNVVWASLLLLKQFWAVEAWTTPLKMSFVIWHQEVGSTCFKAISGNVSALKCLKMLHILLCANIIPNVFNNFSNTEKRSYLFKVCVSCKQLLKVGFSFFSPQNTAGVSQENSIAESPKQPKWMVTSFQTENKTTERKRNICPHTACLV